MKNLWLRYIYDKKQFVISAAIYFLAIFCLFFIGKVFGDFRYGLLVATGLVLIRAVLGFIFKKSSRNFPNLSGIIDGCCVSVFFIIITAMIK